MQLPLFSAVVMLLSLGYSVIAVQMASFNSDSLSQQRNYATVAAHVNHYTLQLQQLSVEAPEHGTARTRSYSKMGNYPGAAEESISEYQQFNLVDISVEIMAVDAINTNAFNRNVINTYKRKMSIIS